MEFKEFDLHPDLQRGIADAGYVTCMPVQEQVLTNAFGGHDLYVQSQTGTGKTAAFLVVIFQRLLSEPLLNGKKALIMVPTRELAVQVEEEAKLLGKYLPFKAGSFYGGVGYVHQQKMLRDNVQILVGTPGRVLDLNKSGQMNLMDLAFLVLDEADRMFDMGFYPDLRKLIKVVPPVDRRQTMLFSATLNSWVKNLAWEYTKKPIEIEIEPETVTVEEIDQLLYHVTSEDKMKLLMGILEREKPESALIFCNTKRYAEIVAKRLRINGIECEFIIGDLPQSKRLKIIDDVKSGKVHFLVATDVAARGLDIDGLSMVINFDIPVESENYVHRIGRTARAGKTGKAISLASEQDVYELPDIEKYIGKKIPSQIAGEELFAEDKSEGMRIRTDSYDDRRDERSGGRRGGERRDSGRRDRPRDGRSRAVERSRQHEHSDSHRPRSTGSAEGRRPRNEERPPRQEGQGRGGPQKAAGGPDLSNLSFDERMAYYRQKYEGESGNAGNQKRSQKRTQERSDYPRRKGSPEKQRKDSSPGQKKRTEQKKTSGQKARTAQGPAPAQGKPEKKGLFSRLIGMFKKEP